MKWIWVIRAGLWGHIAGDLFKTKISAMILVLDIAATMVGGTRIYWGAKKGCSGRNLRDFCGFCFLGFLRRRPRQPFHIKLIILDLSRKWQMFIKVGRKREKLWLFEREGNEGVMENGDGRSDFHRIGTKQLSPDFFRSLFDRKAFSALHLPCKSHRPK